MHPRVRQLIKQLHLQPHPEGGYFREVYRSDMKIHSTCVDEQRVVATDIYFLLPEGAISRWHRVAHDELWNFYEGDPLSLQLISPDLSRHRSCQLDPRVGCFKQLVPGGHWQAAESSGAYTLVGCTVAPGFEFVDFCLLTQLPEMAARLHAEYPELARFL